MDRDKRISVDLAGDLTTEDGVLVGVRVLDLSASGFRLVADDELLLGERVLLRIGRGDGMPATVKWVVGREVGGSFLQKAKTVL